MLKFIKHHMETIWGIEIFPLISFIIFFTFFTVLLIWVYRSKKETFDRIAQIPLEDQEVTESKNSKKS